MALQVFAMAEGGLQLWYCVCPVKVIQQKYVIFKNQAFKVFLWGEPFLGLHCYQAMV
jgi:hypothetical protein